MAKTLRYTPIEDVIERGALLALYFGPTIHAVSDFTEAWDYMCAIDGEPIGSLRTRALDRVLATERARMRNMGFKLPFTTLGERPPLVHSGMLGVVWK